MIIFKKVRFKNLLSYGNIFTEFELDKDSITYLMGRTGYGKCLHKFTTIEIKIDNPIVELGLYSLSKNIGSNKSCYEKSITTLLDVELFYKLYRKATKHKFGFLYIDTASGEYRRNFNEQFVIKEEMEEF